MFREKLFVPYVIYDCSFIKEEQSFQLSVNYNLLCFGLNHRSAPIDLLEQMSFDARRMNEFLTQLRESGNVTEAFGISTCNRTEFFCLAHNVSEALQQIFSLVDDFCPVDIRKQADHTYLRQAKEAVRHLFQIAAGVDSLIIGETEIMGQIRKTREMALKSGHISNLMDELLLQALEVGAKVRRETGVSRGNVSVASVAFSLAKRQFEEFDGLHAVVLGAGDTAETAVIHLKEKGVAEITVANRTLDKAKLLAGKVGGYAADLADISVLLRSADIVICATGAPEYVVTAEIIRNGMVNRERGQLLFLDISVPRNVEPLSQTIAGVTIINVDDLQSIAQENRIEREAHIVHANNLIDHETEDFLDGLLQHHSHRLIAEIHRKAEDIRQDHLQKFAGYFDEVHRDHLETFTAGLTRKLFHEITQNIRNLEADTSEGLAQLQALEKLFNLTPGE